MRARGTTLRSARGSWPQMRSPAASPTQLRDRQQNHPRGQAKRTSWHRQPSPSTCQTASTASPTRLHRRTSASLIMPRSVWWSMVSRRRWSAYVPCRSRNCWSINGLAIWWLACCPATRSMTLARTATCPRLDLYAMTWARLLGMSARAPWTGPLEPSRPFRWQPPAILLDSDE